MLSSVSWIAPAGGDWGVGANWSTGTVPGTSDTAIIASLNPGAQVTYNTGNSTVAAVQASSPLEITGGTLTVTGSTQITGTTLTLDGGTLADTTLSTASGGVIQTASGSTTTLDAATLGSNTTLTVASGSTLDVADNLTLGSGATIIVDAGGTLNFIDGTSNIQAIAMSSGGGTATITLDAASGSYAAAQLNANGANSSSQVTFDNGVNITGLGTSTAPNTITAAGGNTIAFDDTVTNATISSSGGYLQADGAYGSATVFDAVTLANNVAIGSSTYGSGAYLNVADGLTFQNGAILSFGAMFGTLTFVGGTSQSIQGSGTVALTTQANGTTVISPFSGTLSVSSGSSVTIGSGVQITMGSATYSGGGYGGYGPPGFGSNSTTNITINGNLISDGAITSAGGDVTVSGSGTLTNSGGITVGTNGSTATNNTFTISTNVQGYAAFNANGGVIDFSSGTSTLEAGTVLEASAGGTIELTGGTLAVDAAVNANSLGLSGGTLTGNSSGALTLTGSATWSGGTILGLPVTVASGATLNISANGAINTTITNNGAVTLNGSGQLTLSNNAQIDNYGTFDVANGASFSAGDATAVAFDNYGTFETTTGAGTVTFNSYNGNAGVMFNNEYNAQTGVGGTVVVDAGTLNFTAGGTNYNPNTITSPGGPAFTVSGSSSVLEFNLMLSTDTFTLQSDTTINATGGGQVDLNWGTLTTNGILTANSFNFNNGTINGSGSVSLIGSDTWSAGTSDAPILVETDATLDIMSSAPIISGADFTNDGTVDMTNSGQVTLSSKALIDNYGTFNIANNNGQFSASDTTAVAFDNYGVFETTTGAGNTSFNSYNGNAGVMFNNESAGTVVVDAGTLNFTAGGTNYNPNTITSPGGPAFTVSGSSSVLEFNLTLSTDTFTLQSDTTISATDGGQVDLNWGTLTTNGILTVNSFNFNNGTINGSGSVSLTGSDSWSVGTTGAPVVVQAGATLDIMSSASIVSGADFTNDGTVDMTNAGQVTLSSNAQIDNYGTFNVENNNGQFSAGDNTSVAFDNYGRFETTTGAGTVTFNSYDGNAGVMFNNEYNTQTGVGGTVVVEAGTLNFTAGGTNYNPNTITSPGGPAFTVSGSSSVLEFNLTLSTDTFTLQSDTTINATGGAQVDLNWGTLTTNGILTVNSFNFNNGTINGSGSVSLTGSDTWSVGTMGVPVVVQAGATLDIMSSASIISGADFTNDGMVDMTNSGQVTLSSKALIDNYGTFNIENNNAQFSAGDTTAVMFNNYGVFETTTGAGNTSFNSYYLGGGVVFNNQSAGTVAVDAGILQFQVGGTNYNPNTTTSPGGPAFAANGSGSVLEFNGGTFTFQCDTTMNAGNTGQFELANGYLVATANTTTNSLVVTFGTLTTAGTLTVSGLNFSNGTIQNASSGGGSVIMTDTDNLWTGGMMSSLAVTLENSAALSWNGGTLASGSMALSNEALLAIGATGTPVLSASSLTVVDGATATIAADGMSLAAASQIDNQHGAVFNFIADGILAVTDSSTPVFTNDGLIEKTGGTGAIGGGIGAKLLNNSDGLVNAASGRLLLAGGGTDDGTIRATWGIAEFAGGAMTVAANAPLLTAGIGQIALGGGTLYLNSTVVARNWDFTGGTLEAASGVDFIVDGVLSWSSATVTIPMEISSGATLVLYSGGTLDGTGLTNNGVISVQDGGSLNLTNNALIVNDANASNTGLPVIFDGELPGLWAANGIIEIAGSGGFSSGDDSGGMFNFSLIEVYGNTGSSFNINLSMQNYGTLSAVTGELDVTGIGTNEVLAGSLTATDGGILYIQGTWTLGHIQAVTSLANGTSDSGYILVNASLTVSGGAYISTLPTKPPTHGLPGAWSGPSATLWFVGSSAINLGGSTDLEIGQGVSLDGNVAFGGGGGYSTTGAGEATVYGAGQILVWTQDQLNALHPSGYYVGNGGYYNSSGQYVAYPPTYYYPPFQVLCSTGLLPSTAATPSSTPPAQTMLGSAMAISPTEVVFGWDWNAVGTNPFTTSGYTYSISYSTDGANFTTVATSLPHGNYYVFENLRPDTYYYFQVEATSPGGTVTSWRSGPTMTNSTAVNTGLGIAVSNDQAGYFQITGLTDASGNTVSPADYNAGIIYAGSQQGAVLIALQNLLSTTTVSGTYMYGSDAIPWGPVIENVAAQDYPGLYGAGNIQADVTGGAYEIALSAAQWEAMTGETIIAFIGQSYGVNVNGPWPDTEYMQVVAEADGNPVIQFKASVANRTPSTTTPASAADPILDSTGATQIVDTDLTAGGFTGAWSITRNWTPDASLVPDNTFGNAWMNLSQTYLQEFVGQSAANPDIMLIHSSYWQTTFNYNSTANSYSALGASTDTLVHDTANGTYIWTDESGADGNPIGSQRIYYDFSPAVPTYLQGKLMQYVDPFGNAINLTYNNVGQLTTVTQTDAAGDTETFAYSYNIDGQITLIQQSIQRVGDSAPTVFRQAVYSYYQGTYTGSDAYGNFGDLKTVTIEDGSGNVLSEDYYRYYTPADLNAGAQGYVGALMYSFSADSFTKLAAAFTDPFTATDAQIAPYADEAYTWNNQRQVVGEVVGSMGASANLGQGNYVLGYTFNPALQSMTYSNLNYNTWVTQATEILPDGNENLVYVNIDGNVILDINNTSTDPGNPANVGKNWITGYQYDSNGRLIDTISPSAINLNASILNGATTVPQLEAALSQYADAGLSEGLIQANTGLILSSTYYSSTTATGTAAGGVTGYLEADYVQQGSSGTPIEQDSYTYIAHTNYSGTTIYPEASYTQYQSSANNGSTPETTTYSYSWQNNVGNLSTNQIADLTTTNPVVSTSQNGSGTATSNQTVYNQFGLPVWTMDEKGYITYTAYDNATGAVIQSVQDVNTANLSDLTNYSGAYPGGTLAFGSNGYNQLGVPELPSGWATPAGGGLNLVTSYKVDNLGRPTEITSPNGNINYIIYDDVNHAVFTFTGVTETLDQNGNGTAVTTGPITMTRTEIPYSYTANGQTLEGTYSESLTFSGTLTVTGGVIQLPGFIQGNGATTGDANVLNLIGNGSSSAPQFIIQSLSRVLYNNSGRIAGQMVESDAYANITNSVYLATAVNSPYSGAEITNQLSGQAPNGNYYATYYGYDADGRQYQIIDANGTIKDTVYDSLGRVVSDWVGTNDATNNGQPFTGSNTGTGNNMTEVESYVYDNGSVGDSNVTEAIQYPDGNTTGTQRVSVLNYDFRDRLVATETGLTLDSSGNAVTSSSDAYPQITVYTMDNLGDVTATSTFNGGATTLAAAIGAASSASPGAAIAGLVGYSTSEYDSQNRDYEDQVYSVDPTTGTISTTALTSYIFYGPRGNVIETVAPTGLVTKDVYDGADRLVDVYVTDGGAVNNGGSMVLNYAAAGSVANDVVVSQTAYGYDGDGNLIETVHAQRFNTDPITGSAAEGALFTDTVNSDGSLNVTPASNSNSSLSARIYYSATYYDAADREIATVNAGTNPVGTNGAATPWTRPATAPTAYNDANFPGDLITLTNYNAAGEVYETTDPRGIVAASFYNSLGETTETIAAYNPSVNSGNPTNDQNQTTLYTYDGLGNQTSMTAEDPSTGNQTTTYIYGVSTATGSSITSNDLLYQTVYPSVPSNPSPVTSASYNALGQTISTTDRNGNVHQYTYDTAGREISDTVTTLGAGVDGSVRRIDTAYNAEGLAYLYTSYADTAGTQIVNQVENIYNGLGQLAFQYQALTGAVDVSTTPFVEYTYSSPTNGSRLASMVYPNGRTIDYNYSGTNLNSALDNAIGRLDSISDGANSGDAGQVLEQYSYLGLNTIVARNHPQDGINLTLVGSSGSIGSGGDQYLGLDQFGRIADQNWVNSATGQSTDNFTYSYDGNSNVTAENNLLDTAYSQTFTYDPLNRVSSSTLGGVANQSWTLDSQGNWSSFTSNGTTQTQTANAQNQITSVSGSTTPTYDANGNMTTDQSGNTYTYNAWNQLVTLKNSSGQVIAQYTYNAMGYRVTESYPQGGNGVAAGTVNYIYYTASWQRIEVRQNGTANSNVLYQYVPSVAYSNANVLRDTYSASVIQPNSRLYFLQDANWNTTAIVGYNSTTGTWGVAQRYVYSPYGTITVLNADWSTPPTGTQPLVNNLYQGMTLDPATRLYYARNRNYSPSLGRWINQDPAGYINGANTYQFVMSNPVGNVDPWGLYSLTEGGVTFTDNGNNAAATVNYHPAAPLEGTPVAPPPSPWLLAPGMLPRAITPHTAAEGLADTAQGVQNGLLGLLNLGLQMSPLGQAYLALKQEIKAMRGWLAGIPNLQWDPYNDPTKPWSEGLGAFAGPNLLLGPLGEFGPVEDALAGMGPCFAAGTLVLTSHGKVQIEQVSIGQRVITQPAGMEEPPDMPVDPANYRVLCLEYTEPKSGSVLELTLLRPAGQFARLGRGDMVSLKVLELRVEGEARVTSVSPCPPIEDGPGQLVTGTYISRSVDLRLLKMKGLDKPIEVTGRHPIYCESRSDFVRVSELSVGERFRTRTGNVEIESIDRAKGEHQVFNLEIGNVHQYYVSELEILVHNGCTEIAQELLDNGASGQIYRLSPRPPGMQLGVNGWFYHDVVYDPATGMVIDPMRTGSTEGIPFQQWIDNYFGGDASLFNFGPMP